MKQHTWHAGSMNRWLLTTSRRRVARVRRFLQLLVPLRIPVAHALGTVHGAIKLAWVAAAEPRACDAIAYRARRRERATPDPEPREIDYDDLAYTSSGMAGQMAVAVGSRFSGRRGRAR